MCVSAEQTRLLAPRPIHSSVLAQDFLSAVVEHSSFRQKPDLQVLSSEHLAPSLSLNVHLLIDVSQYSLKSHSEFELQGR